MSETNLTLAPTLNAKSEADFSSTHSRNFASTLLAQVGMLGLNVFTGVASARLLGPRARGELAALMLWPSWLILLGSLGINQSIVFYTGRRRYDASEICTAMTITGLLQSLCVILVGLIAVPLALRGYSPGVVHLGLVFLFFAPALMLGGYPGNLLQGKLDLLSFNFLRLIPSLTYALGLSGLFLLKRPSLNNVVGVQILGLALAFLGGYALLFAKEPVHFAINRQTFKDLLSYGWKSQLSNVTYYINQRLDQLLLSLFVAPHELGLYVVAVTVSTSLSFFPDASAIVTLASGSNVEPARARIVIANSFRSALVWLLLGCAALFVLVPWLIPFAFGAKFKGSVLACRILLPGAVVLGLNRLLYAGARSMNHPALPSYAEGLAMILTGGGLYILLPRLGFLGAAIASTAAYAASFALMIIFCRIRLDIGLRELFAISPEQRENREGKGGR
jgi:O-antigen/teichoic acid export membrane protein